MNLLFFFAVSIVSVVLRNAVSSKTIPSAIWSDSKNLTYFPTQFFEWLLTVTKAVHVQVVRPELMNIFSCYLVFWQLDWSLKYAKLQFSAMWSRLWWFNIRKSFIFCQIYICSITDPWSTQSCPDRPGHNFQPRSIYWIEHLEMEFKNETF